MNEYVFRSLVRVFDPYVLKAADRRDRLIYVLSQINAARGEGAAEVEESSSEEEEVEDEVRWLLSHTTNAENLSHSRNSTQKGL